MAALQSRCQVPSKGNGRSRMLVGDEIPQSVPCRAPLGSTRSLAEGRAMTIPTWLDASSGCVACKKSRPPCELLVGGSVPSGALSTVPRGGHSPSAYALTVYCIKSATVASKDPMQALASRRLTAALPVLSATITETALSRPIRAPQSPSCTVNTPAHCCAGQSAAFRVPFPPGNDRLLSGESLTLRRMKGSKSADP